MKIVYLRNVRQEQSSHNAHDNISKRDNISSGFASTCTVSFIFNIPLDLGSCSGCIRKTLRNFARNSSVNSALQELLDT